MVGGPMTVGMSHGNVWWGSPFLGFNASSEKSAANDEQVWRARPNADAPSRALYSYVALWLEPGSSPFPSKPHAVPD
eukprot:4172686-Prymnesium_polylepis.1